MKKRKGGGEKGKEKRGRGREERAHQDKTCKSNSRESLPFHFLSRGKRGRGKVKVTRRGRADFAAKVPYALITAPPYFSRGKREKERKKKEGRENRENHQPVA